MSVAILRRMSTVERVAPIARRRLAIVPGVFAALLVACGGGAGTVGSGGPAATAPSAAATTPAGVETQATGGGGGAAVDACGLLSDADIKDLTGHGVAQRAAGDPLGIFGHGCMWELAVEGGSPVPPQINLGVMTTGGRAFWDAYFAPIIDEYVPIEGLGDVAVDAGVKSIMVVSGDAFFQVQYFPGYGFADAHQAELARRILANLGG
jgi:hypothetical protein